MRYAEIEDLARLLPMETMIGLTDDSDQGVVDADIVNSALESASVVIDGYLAGRYTLPLSTIPAILTGLCVDLAGNLLFIRRDQKSEHWSQREQNATRFLAKLASGELTLGIAEPTGTGDHESIRTTGPEPQFISSELEKF